MASPLYRDLCRHCGQRCLSDHHPLLTCGCGGEMSRRLRLYTGLLDVIAAPPSTLPPSTPAAHLGQLLAGARYDPPLSMSALMAVACFHTYRSGNYCRLAAHTQALTLLLSQVLHSCEHCR